MSRALGPDGGVFSEWFLYWNVLRIRPTGRNSFLRDKLYGWQKISVCDSASGSGRCGRKRRSTQIELCHKIDIEQKTLSSIENGRMEPCLRYIEFLAIGLGVTLGKLFKDL